MAIDCFLDVDKCKKRNDWRAQCNQKKFPYLNAVYDGEETRQTINRDSLELDSSAYLELTKSNREDLLAEASFEHPIAT